MDRGSAICSIAETLAENVVARVRIPAAKVDSRERAVLTDHEPAHGGRAFRIRLGTAQEDSSPSIPRVP
jgi:hypothetical protein